MANRKNTVYFIFGIVLIFEMVMLFLNAGVVKGMNNRADRLREMTTVSCDDKAILPGDIYDRNGEMIVETKYETVTETSEDGNEKEVSKKITHYSDDYAYSQTVGYTGNHEYHSTEDQTDTGIGNRNAIRLMAFLDEDYWGKNGLYSTVGESGTKGQNAILTIDSGLQMKVFNAMKKEMNPSASVGSAVVLDAKTGEVLADVSFPTYNFNDLNQAKKDMMEDGENTNLEPGYPVTYKNPKTPGSIFKILTSVALIDHGMEDFTVKNEEYTVANSWTCKTYGYESNTMKVDEGDTINLEKGLNISSNVYFSKAALELGTEALNETAEKFGLKKDENTVLSDFGNIYYHWDPDVSDDILAQTGFGQGNTELTSMFAAMMMEAIANNGKMMKPYMVKRLENEKGKIVYKGKPEVLHEATSKKTADKVTKYLQSTAKECCSLHHLEDVAKVFDKYKVAGKTGTAENGDAADTNNAWYVSFAPANNPKYVVVVNQCNTNKAGYEMMPVVAEIYQYLFENE